MREAIKKQLENDNKIYCRTKTRVKCLNINDEIPNECLYKLEHILKGEKN